MKKLYCLFLVMFLGACGEQPKEVFIDTKVGADEEPAVDPVDKDVFIQELKNRISELEEQNLILSNKKCPRTVFSGGGGGGGSGSSCPVCHNDSELLAANEELTADLNQCETDRDTCITDRDTCIVERDTALHDRDTCQENNAIIQADLNQCVVDLESCLNCDHGDHCTPSNEV